MEVIKTIRPGKDGSKRYHETYGERLVCVRYRRDRNGGRNLITVELVVDQIPHPGPRQPSLPLPDPDAIVYLKVASYEHDLQQKLRAKGGRWDRDSGRWRIGYQAACRLRLAQRIDQEMSFGGVMDRGTIGYWGLPGVIETGGPGIA